MLRPSKTPAASEAPSSPAPKPRQRKAATPAKFVRAISFGLISFTLSLVIAVVDFVLFPIVYFVDPKRKLYATFLSWLGKFIMCLFAKIEVRGLENIPENEEACVIAVNHQSFLDPFVLGYLPVNFRAAFKKALLFYPGVGQVLFLSGHLSVQRGDKSSGAKLIAGAEDYIRRGICFVFFPEGTRKIDAAKGPLGEFKAGAFKVSVDTGAPILPVTISGARAMLPPSKLPQMACGDVILTVHPLIYPTGKDVSTLMQETHTVIASALRPCDA